MEIGLIGFPNFLKRRSERSVFFEIAFVNGGRPDAITKHCRSSETAPRKGSRTSPVRLKAVSTTLVTSRAGEDRTHRPGKSRSRNSALPTY
ncbi:hypothetical protein [Caballeronia telluris]|uniref:hypothetical protein n=1 Tax=Caballeronia telluris TaxID=326475 RepID=UPI000AF04685|nr:hypothetical protein [Caballeronia telluris]